MARKRKYKKRKKKQPVVLKIKKETTHSIAGTALIVLGLLVTVSFSGQGQLLAKVNQFLIRELGFSMLFLPFVFISAGLVMFQTKWKWSKPHVLLGVILLMLGSMGALKAGDIGEKTFVNFAQLLSTTGAYVVFFGVLIIGLLIMLQLSFAEIVEGLFKMKEKRQKKQEEKVTQKVEKEIKKAKGFQLLKLSLPFSRKGEMKINQGEDGTAQSTQKQNDGQIGTAVEGKAPPIIPADGDNPPGLSDTTVNTRQMIWEYPPLSLLSSSRGGEADRGDVKENAQIIENTLDSFGIKASVVEVNYGPSVTQYALEISKGTKLSRITNLSIDLALSLAAPTGQIRIEAPIPGRSLVGIEVPNHAAEFVTLKTMLSAPQMKKHKSKLAWAMGINVSGKPMIVDVAAMPHILVAGATGSGKSVGINSFLCSVLFRASPAEVKFILIDPKRVELTGFNGIPHLLTPVIVDPKKVISALKWSVVEMENRYKKLAEVGVKNIAGYNELAGFAAMPSIVIVIDELADVMLFSPSEVEEAITRIAQMARAVGIHLVLSTQRPSVDIITGLIKANIPARVAFNVSSMTDSRVILDQPGAEKLLGKGDMLFIPPTQAKPMRIQGTYVNDKETKQLMDFLKSQGQQPDYEEEIISKYKTGMVVGAQIGPAGKEVDPLFNEAVKLFAQYDKASSSLIQRRLSVGYARAARILDQLHDAGLVGPNVGSKPREVNMEVIRNYLSQPERVEN
ncbi:DNA translocase FtsK [Patescibacteria group bacterium]|nr:DNA translocase FtsK [Patescibacteria group bacterium]